MNFYLDTEFSERQGSLELISIGIICENGSTFYAESTSFNEVNCNDWVKANVLPKLKFRNDPMLQKAPWCKKLVMTNEDRMVWDGTEFEKHDQPVPHPHYQVYGSNDFIKKHLLEWVAACTAVPAHAIASDLMRHPNPEMYRPEFWAYFCQWDWIVFCWIFGSMLDLPKGWPMLCLDLKQEMMQCNLTAEWKDRVCPDPEGEHNALVDARWNYSLHRAIWGVKKHEAIPKAPRKL